MSIKNYARQDLILDNFLELPESIHFPILTPLIKFCLNQLYPILGHCLIIDLDILQSYYPRSFDQNQSVQLEIQKNFFKNLKTVVPLHSNSKLLTCTLCLPVYLFSRYHKMASGRGFWLSLESWRLFFWIYFLNCTISFIHLWNIISFVMLLNFDMYWNFVYHYYHVMPVNTKKMADLKDDILSKTDVKFSKFKLDILVELK